MDIPYGGIDIGKVSKKKHPAKRWIVDRMRRWLNLCRGIKIRYEVKAINQIGIVQIANAIKYYKSC